MILLLRHLRRLRLGLGHPGQDLVITPDVLHIVDRLTTPGIAVAGLAVPLFLRQQRQMILHVNPAIRIATIVTGENARIIQMAQTNVISRQREPGTVGLGNVGGQLVTHPHQITRAPGDALRRIDPVGHANEFGGGQGQHHQPSHASGGAGVGVPEGFLIGHRRKQSPIHALLIRRLAKQLLEARQPLLHVSGKGAGADIVEHVGVPIEALEQLIESAIGADTVEEPVHLQQQALVFATGQGPCHGLRRAEVKADVQGRVETLVHHQLVGIHHGVVDLAVVDHAQQVDRFKTVGFFEYQLRMFDLQLAQLVGQCAAFQHGDASFVQVLDTPRLPIAPTIHHLRRHLQVGLGKVNLLGAIGVGGQPGGGNVWPLAVDQLTVQIIQRRAGDHLQFHIQAVGKALAQLVLQTGIAVPALIVGGGRVAGDDAQGALLAQLFEAAGLLAGGQQYRAKQRQGGGRD